MEKEDINRVPRALTNSLNSKLMDQLYDLIPGTNVVVDLIVYLSRHQIGDGFRWSSSDLRVTSVNSDDVMTGEKSPALSPRIKTPTAVLALPENVMSCENAKEAERTQTVPNTAVRHRRTSCNIFKINNFILSLRVQGMQR